MKPTMRTELELMQQDLDALFLNLNNVIKVVNQVIEAGRNSDLLLKDINKRVKKLERPSYDVVILDDDEVI